MITITPNDIISSTSYVTEILTDLKPIINMLAGIWIAFWVIPAIIKLVKLFTEREDDLDEWFYDETGLIPRPESFENSYTEKELDDLSAMRFTARLLKNSTDEDFKKKIRKILRD